MSPHYKDKLLDLLDYHGVYKNKAFVDSLIEFINEYGIEIVSKTNKNKQITPENTCQ
jgi:hypothetical protein